MISPQLHWVPITFLLLLAITSSHVEGSRDLKLTVSFADYYSTLPVTPPVLITRSGLPSGGSPSDGAPRGKAYGCYNGLCWEYYSAIKWCYTSELFAGVCRKCRDEADCITPMFMGCCAWLMTKSGVNIGGLSNFSKSLYLLDLLFLGDCIFHQEDFPGLSWCWIRGSRFERMRARNCSDQWRCWLLSMKCIVNIIRFFKTDELVDRIPTCLDMVKSRDDMCYMGSCVWNTLCRQEIFTVVRCLRVWWDWRFGLIGNMRSWLCCLTKIVNVVVVKQLWFGQFESISLIQSAMVDWLNHCLLRLIKLVCQPELGPHDAVENHVA